MKILFSKITLNLHNIKLSQHSVRKLEGTMATVSSQMRNIVRLDSSPPLYPFSSDTDNEDCVYLFQDLVNDDFTVILVKNINPDRVIRRIFKTTLDEGPIEVSSSRSPNVPSSENTILVFDTPDTERRVVKLVEIQLVPETNLIDVIETERIDIISMADQSVVEYGVPRVISSTKVEVGGDPFPINYV